GGGQGPGGEGEGEDEDAEQRDQRGDRREFLRKADAGLAEQEPEQRLVDQPAEQDTERPAGDGQDHRLRAEDPPDVTGPGAQAAQDPDLPGALDDAHAQGADQAHQADGDDQQAQDLNDGQEGGRGRCRLRLDNVDLRGGSAVPRGEEPVRESGGCHVDGGRGGAGGRDREGVRRAGPAVEAFQGRQREVDGVAAIGGDGVDPDDAGPGGSCGDGEDQDLSDPGMDGSCDRGAQHHRRAGRPAAYRATLGGQTT